MASYFSMFFMYYFLFFNCLCRFSFALLFVFFFHSVCLLFSLFCLPFCGFAFFLRLFFRFSPWRLLGVVRAWGGGPLTTTFLVSCRGWVGRRARQQASKNSLLLTCGMLFKGRKTS